MTCWTHHLSPETPCWGTRIYCERCCSVVTSRLPGVMFLTLKETKKINNHPVSLFPTCEWAICVHTWPFNSCTAGRADWAVRFIWHCWNFSLCLPLYICLGWTALCSSTVLMFWFCCHKHGWRMFWRDVRTHPVVSGFCMLNQRSLAQRSSHSRVLSVPVVCRNPECKHFIVTTGLFDPYCETESDKHNLLLLPRRH